MTEDLQNELNAALNAGAINEQEILDVISRGYVRMKHGLAERVIKAIDDGASEAEFVAVIEKRR